MTDSRSKPDPDWNIKVDAMNLASIVRAKQITDRLQHNIKALGKLPKMSALSIGVTRSLKAGLVITDEAGLLRCPPGTPNAMQFTDMKGSNCGVPGKQIANAVRLNVADVAKEVGDQAIVKRKPVTREALGQYADAVLGGSTPARKRLADSIRKLFGQKSAESMDGPNLTDIIRNHSGGFSWDLATGEALEEGYAVARQGRGFRLRADMMTEIGDDGKPVPTEEARLRLAQLVAMNRDDFTGITEVEVDGKKIKSSRTVLGGWKDGDAYDADGNPILGADGEVMSYADAIEAGMDAYQYWYFDVVDIFDESIGDEAAYQIGKDRNQKSVAKLSEIVAGNDGPVTIDDVMNGRTGGLIETEGTGGDLIAPESFDSRLANAVSMLAPGGRYERTLEAIAGSDTLDLENFDGLQIRNMLSYLSVAPGFEWIDPDNFDHLHLAITQLSDNLLYLIGRTSTEDREKWSQWYDIANRFATGIADDVGIEQHTAAAITAILSPQKDWDQNMAMAEHLMRMMGGDDPIPEVVAKLSAVQLQKLLKSARDGSAIKTINGKLDTKRNQLDKATTELSKLTENVDKPNLEKIGEKSDQISELMEDIAKLESQLEFEQGLYDMANGGIDLNDLKGLTAEFAGKRPSELNDVYASIAVRYHSDTVGGLLLGQTPVEKDGVVSNRVRAWEVVFNPDDPLNYDVVEAISDDGTERVVAAQDFDTYLKAVRAFRSGGDMSILDKQIGGQSKVRSFYNNINTPNDEMHRDTTMDTHAVAGLLLLPLPAKDELVNTAFSTPKSLGTGRSYAIYRAAMILAAERWAEQTGEKYLPRQIQSITWELARQLFPLSSKSKKDGFIQYASEIQRMANSASENKLTRERAYEALTAFTDVSSLSSKEFKAIYGTKVNRAAVYREIASRYGLTPLSDADLKALVAAEKAAAEAKKQEKAQKAKKAAEAAKG